MRVGNEAGVPGGKPARPRIQAQRQRSYPVASARLLACALFELPDTGGQEAPVTGARHRY